MHSNERIRLAKELGYESMRDRVPTRAHLEDEFEDLAGEKLDLAVMLANWCNYQQLSEEDPELGAAILQYAGSAVL